MFTGLITAIGEIIHAQAQDSGLRLRIASPYKNLALGESIACNGACLTVVEYEGGQFDVELSGETVRCTAPNAWNIGAKLNLERALCVGDRLGGHFVTGHVDGLATLSNITKQGDYFALTLHAPLDLMRYIAPKGSVALNGVSLTVNEVADDQFGVMIIPHTWAHTNLHLLHASAKLHLEIDLLARYVLNGNKKNQADYE